MIKRDDFVKWFSDLSNKDVNIAGGKGASLAEMYRHKFPVPPGFVITADSYKYFLDKAGIRNDLKRMLSEKPAEMTVLHDTVKAVGASSDMDEVLSLVFENAVKALRANDGSLMLLDPEKGVLIIKRAHGLDEEIIGNTRIVDHLLVGK